MSNNQSPSYPKNDPKNPQPAKPAVPDPKTDKQRSDDASPRDPSKRQ